MKEMAIMLLGCVGWLGMSCSAQSKCSSFGDGNISGLKYSNSKLGLSYTFPAGLESQDLRTVPPAEQKTDSMNLLLLWKNPRQFEKPSIIVMTDNPASYPDPTAMGYVRRIETTVVKYGSAKILQHAREFDLSGLKFYRLDWAFREPNAVQNAAITGQVGGCEISFQLTARTQQEIEEYVTSLKTVEFKVEKKNHLPSNKPKQNSKKPAA